MGTDAYIKVIRTGADIFVDRLKNIMNEHTIGTDYLHWLQERVIKRDSLIRMLEELNVKNFGHDHIYLDVIDKVKAFREDDTFKLLDETQDEYWEG